LGNYIHVTAFTSGKMPLLKINSKGVAHLVEKHYNTYPLFVKRSLGGSSLFGKIPQNLCLLILIDSPVSFDFNQPAA